MADWYIFAARVHIMYHERKICLDVMSLCDVLMITRLKIYIFRRETEAIKNACENEWFQPNPIFFILSQYYYVSSIYTKSQN